MVDLVLIPQLDGSDLASENCGCAAGAMLVFHETSGTKRPRGADVRALVREPNGTFNVTGGTSPGQVARALAEGWDVTVDPV